MGIDLRKDVDWMRENPSESLSFRENVEIEAESRRILGETVRDELEAAGVELSGSYEQVSRDIAGFPPYKELEQWYEEEMEALDREEYEIQELVDELKSRVAETAIENYFRD